MYPVLSVLRRAAVSYVYVTPQMLQRRKTDFCIRLAGKSHYLELASGTWSTAAHDLIPVLELEVVAETPESAAVSLAKKENELAAAFKAEDALYTLVLGPEEERMVQGRVVRRFRCAVIEGVYRVSKSQQLEPEPAKNVTKARFAGGPAKRGIRLDD